MSNLAHAYAEQPQAAPAEHWCRGCLGRTLRPIGHKDGFDLLRCADCATVVVDPYPSDAELTAFYTNYGKNSDYLRKQEQKVQRCLGRVKRMMRHKPPGKRFLDVGCNVGYAVEAARQLGLEAKGIDIDPVAIGIARDTFPQTAGFEALWVEELASRGERFDMIYTSEVVEHVRDPEAFIQSVATLLNPRGLLYLTAPDGAHFRVPRDFASWPMVCPPNHLTYFSRGGMGRLLARHGLVVEGYQLAMKPGLKVFARKT